MSFRGIHGLIDLLVMQETDGSMIIYPLKDKSNLTVQYGVIGTFAVDTLMGKNNLQFLRHQLHFYQVSYFAFCCFRACVHLLSDIHPLS